MSNKTLICMVGLPRSGKTTWAKKYAEQCGGVIVNPDSIRLALTGKRFLPSAEGQVWVTAHLMVESLFEYGYETVILDATNVRRNRRNEWQDKRWRTVFKVLSTSKNLCISRALNLDGSIYADLEPVIERMYKSWEDLGDNELDLDNPTKGQPFGL